MKAISLSRPWPWVILTLGKRLENRSRKDHRMPAICGHRGPLLLQAAKSWDYKAKWWMESHGIDASGLYDAMHPAGAIVGYCKAVAHVDPAGRFFVDPKATEPDELVVSAELDMRWHMDGCYALVLRDVRPTHIVPCRGHQGLWTPPDRIVERAMAA